MIVRSRAKSSNRGVSRRRREDVSRGDAKEEIRCRRIRRYYRVVRWEDERSGRLEEGKTEEEGEVNRQSAYFDSGEAISAHMIRVRGY